MSDAKRVIDFDHHSSEYARNWQSIVNDVRESAPVAWTEAHGGYWVVSRYDDVIAVTKDWQTYSSENDIAGNGNGGHGVFIPRNPNKFALTESDPPQSTSLRKLEQNHFQYRSVAGWEPVAKGHASEALDEVISTGQIEFVHDICLTVPAKTVLQLAGVPLADWKAFALTAHETSHLPPTHPDYPHKEIAFVQQLIIDLVRRRRREPLADIASSLANGTLDDEPLSDELAASVLSAVVFAGFDTAATAIADALIFLDDKPEMRRLLLEDRKKMEAAIEEWLRLMPPNHCLGRTVMRDVDLRDQRLKTGDRVLLLWSAANRDPRMFENPDDFWLERPNAGKHVSFSNGLHRCLGSILAKMEIRIVLTAFLERIGDYRIDVQAIRRFDAIGNIAGYKSVPARFTARAAGTRA